MFKNQTKLPRVDPFMKRVFETIHSPTNDCLEWDDDQGGIKLTNPSRLSETFEGICGINLANSFYNRMKTYDFRKRKINGYEYFFSDQFDPNDENCLYRIKRETYKEKQRKQKEARKALNEIDENREIERGMRTYNKGTITLGTNVVPQYPKSINTMNSEQENQEQKSMFISNRINQTNFIPINQELNQMNEMQELPQMNYTNQVDNLNQQIQFDTSHQSNQIDYSNNTNNSFQSNQQTSYQQIPEGYVVTKDELNEMNLYLSNIENRLTRIDFQMEYFNQTQTTLESIITEFISKYHSSNGNDNQ